MKSVRFFPFDFVSILIQSTVMPVVWLAKLFFDFKLHEKKFTVFVCLVSMNVVLFVADCCWYVHTQMLVSAVQSGELDLPGYCDILKERVTRDKVRPCGITHELFVGLC